MRKHILLILFLVTGSCIFSQQGQWTWMKGKNEWDPNGVYGTKGVAASANTPCERNNSVTWTDANGDLWLFGGRYYPDGWYEACHNDLWKYSIATNQWTWMSGDNEPNKPGVYGTLGVPHADNKPGARYGSAGWTDANGDLWLFGGHIIELTGDSDPEHMAISKYYNDVWKYHPATNEWTWMKGDSVANKPGVYGEKGISGPANNPGARIIAMPWTDAAGNFWLFGGSGFVANRGEVLFNDLWRYNPATNEWTWMKGDKDPSKPGVYGTPGTPAPTNTPGARLGAVGWTDAEGDLWLFGGIGVAKEAPVFGEPHSSLNDLWKYSTATNQWAWVGGSDKADDLGVYGTLGIPSVTNKPGGRDGCVSWTDATGNFWLYGGYGAMDVNSWGYFSDLWRYSPVTGEWTWIRGANSDQAPVFGHQGVPDPANDPGSRLFGNSWTDASGNFWLFSGSGCSDLWKYTVSTTTPVIEPVSKAFGVTVAPNPSTRHFTLNIVSRNNTPVEIIITDMLGRVVERVPGTRANGHLQLGHAYQPGVYYAEVIQGKDRIIVALMKQ